ncbi:GH36 C-terminal domain-containing protein [Burkholderia contaminans]|nr:GH36 C-terminal domain-containing protein [Burkholderia contaminans]
MKITKLEKKKRLYLMELDNGDKCYITEDTIVRFMLSRDKVISKVMGNLGYELDLTNLSDEEKATIANQVNLYKELRPVVQLGQQYRLINPDTVSNEAAVQFNYGNQTIVTYVRVLSVVETMETTLKLKDLDEEGLYKLQENGEVYSGAELMYAGLTVILSQGDFLSRQYIFRKL